MAKLLLSLTKSNCRGSLTRWLSHGSAFKHCWERYLKIIIEALDDISSNPDLVCFLRYTFRNSNCLSNNILRKCTKCYQHFVTITATWQKGLYCYVLFCKYSFEYLRSYRREIIGKISITLARLLKRIENYQEQNIVSSGSCKSQKQDHYVYKADFL